MKDESGLMEDAAFVEKAKKELTDWCLTLSELTERLECTPKDVTRVIGTLLEEDSRLAIHLEEREDLCPIEEETPQRLEAYRKILQAVETSEKLKELPTPELVALAREFLGGELNIFSAHSNLLDEILERLEKL